jgi:hypothetical protein
MMSENMQLFYTNNYNKKIINIWLLYFLEFNVKHTNFNDLLLIKTINALSYVYLY